MPIYILYNGRELEDIYSISWEGLAEVLGDIDMEDV